jgi:hypothetical protein
MVAVLPVQERIAFRAPIDFKTTRVLGSIVPASFLRAPPG